MADGCPRAPRDPLLPLLLAARAFRFVRKRDEPFAPPACGQRSGQARTARWPNAGPYARRVASSPDRELDVWTLLSDLDGPVASGRRLLIQKAFADAAQPLFVLITEAGGPHRGDGEQAFGVLHLLGRGLTDLIAAVHLATHAYLQQAYALIRPVHEHSDLVELFAQEPQEAARWINHPKPGVEYRPAAVRQRVGGGTDAAEMYGHLSEMGSHPRFAGSRIAGMMRVRQEDPEDRQVILRIGSFFEWHPASVTVYAFIFQALIQLGFKFRHLDLVTEGVTREKWLDSYLECVRRAADGCKLVRAELVALDAGEGTEWLDNVYADLLAALGPDGQLRRM
jgi:hypothetical protein